MKVTDAISYYRDKIKDVISRYNVYSTDDKGNISVTVVYNKSVQDYIDSDSNFRTQINKMIYRFITGDTGSFEEHEEDLRHFLNCLRPEGFYELDKQYDSMFGKCNNIFINIIDSEGPNGFVMYVYFGSER